MFRCTSVVAAVLIATGACSLSNLDRDRVRGSGDIVTETRSIGRFDRILLAGEGGVLFGAGSDGSIEIETDDNLITHIETSVSGSGLTISTERDVDIDPTEGVIYRLGCPNLTGARLSGAGSIDLATCVADELLELEVTGAGDIVARGVGVATLDASLSGAGSISASGRTDRLVISLSGVAGFDGEDLRAAEAEVRSSGVGNVSVWVIDALDLRLSGVGDVRYYGQPRLTQNVTGVGKVQSLGPK